MHGRAASSGGQSSAPTGERQFHYWRSETPAKLWWQYLKSADLEFLERADSMQLYHLRELTNAEVALTGDADGRQIWSNEQEIRLTHGPVTVVDTSGAGDAFNGAYLGARLRGHFPETAGVEGLKLASQVVQLAGAAPEL